MALTFNNANIFPDGVIQRVGSVGFLVGTAMSRVSAVICSTRCSAFENRVSFTAVVTLYSFPKSNVSSEFLNPSLTETQIFEIAALTVEDYSAYTDYLIQNAWKHLRDSVWIQYWKENQTYLINSGIFFDSEASKLMCELSPIFAQYQKNINQLGELLEARLSAEERPLLDAICSSLSPMDDLYANHHAVLIGICI